MAAKLKVGSQVEAYCTKCKLDTIHFITTIDGDTITKVMCDVCGSYHKYRKAENDDADIDTKSATAKKTTKKASTKTATKRKPSKRSLIDWPGSIEKMDTSKAIVYNLQENYEDIDLIDHKTFGLGIIKKVHSESKIEVLFEAGVKTLVHNWHEA